MLAAAAGGLLVLATLLVAGLLRESYMRYQLDAEETTQNVALSLEHFLNAHFLESELALQSAAAEFRRMHKNGSFSQETFSRYLQSLRQRLPNALSVRGTDSEGRIVYGEMVSATRQASIAHRDYFRRVREEMQLVIGLPVTSVLTGERLFPIVQPLTDNEGSFAGTVYVNTATERINALFSSIRVGTHGAIVLFDAERNVIIRQPPVEKTQDEQQLKVAAPETLRALAAGLRSASYKLRSQIDGEVRSVSYRQIGSYPLYVMVGLAEVDYLKPWWRECWLGFSFLLILAGGALALGFSVQRYWRSRVEVEGLLAQQASHDHLSAILRAIPDVLFELDLDGRYLDYRAVDNGLLAQPPAEMIGKKVCDILPTEAARTVMMALAEANELGHSYGAQIHIKVPSGELWFELSIARKDDQRNGTPTFIVLSRDITERNSAKARIEQLAFSDMLTGLPNRRLFLDRLRQSMAVSDRSQNFRALLFLDLDKFKTLNDTLGHQFGDRLLVEVADRLRRAVREYDTVARLGGDEFVVLLEQLGDDENEAILQAQHVAEKITTQLSAEYVLEGYKYLGTTSIGIALFRGQNVSSDELLKRADLAMYQAKSDGRDAVRFFDPQMQANIKARLEMEVELKQALIEKQFLLYFQPQVDSVGRMVGAEALIRWCSPQRGFVSPAIFIPLAEENTLILPIGHWVMHEACACLQAWKTHPRLCDVAISVNVSARQIGLPTFVEEVSALIRHFDIAPGRLKLEITESLLVDKVDDIIAKIKALRALGVAFSLDDFGTGYSSLSYLKRLPFKQVKIDQSFARGVLENSNDAAISRAIIALGHALQLEVVAEGIETEAQWRFFRDEGCRFGQGYLFGRPMPRPELETWQPPILMS